ncbi:hypothetical protein GGX14DRAFT_644768 [Mycena pura]|uniref:Uncharacterized protein n=1 Tax=Mycena pura TaxID=153505 RepID=A0AAD6YCF6_9AGAR|nr:hypothetical protein GGX14DRAFT_644768 [Mycena pura]
MFLGVTALFAMITVHWILVIYQAFLAFVHLGNASIENAFYEDYAQGPEVAKETLVFSVAFLGDALVAYRLWIIWGKNRLVMIFPIFALVGMECVFAQIVKCPQKGEYEASQHEGWHYFLHMEQSHTREIWVRFPPEGNDLTTALPSTNAKFNKWFLVLLVESAAIQTFGEIFIIATGAEVEARDTFPAVVGISNILIHARVGLGWSPDSPATKQQSTQKHGGNV